MNRCLQLLPAGSRAPGAAPWRRPGAAHAGVARFLLGLALGAGLLSAALAQYTVSQFPMLVTSPPPPNVILTVDDSGSMTWAAVPDSVRQYENSVAYTSSAYNSLYYNPSVTYPNPKDAGGNYVPNSTTYPLTSFTAAYNDGFNPDANPVDLSSAYKPTDYQNNGSAPVAPNGSVPGPAYYYQYNPGGTNCPAIVPPRTTVDTSIQPPGPGCFTQQLMTATGVTAAQQQNFAIWYSFYRTRHLAIISAASLAMQDPSLANVRVAWQGLNSCKDFTGANCTGWKGGNYPNEISQFTNGHKADFFNWLFTINASSFTPTREAWWRVGQYLSDPTLGGNSPYGQNPNPCLSSASTTSTAGCPTPVSITPPANPGTPPPSTELMCVNNFNITLTDGLWNDGSEDRTNFCGPLPANAGSCPNADALPALFPDNTSYSPGNPLATIYGDGGTSATSGGDSAIANGGLASIAFYYWSHNLRPDLTNFYLPPYVPDTSTSASVPFAIADGTWPYWNPKNDPATWPHLVNFTVGVGLTGFLSMPGIPWSGDALSGAAYNDLYAAAPDCLPPTVTVTTPSPMPQPTSPCVWPQVTPQASGGGFIGGYLGAGNVYDLWHAAINSRGNAFSAETPQDLISAMGAILARVEGQTIGNSAAAGSSPSLSASTQLYIASYDGKDWHGTVSAYGINQTTGAVNTTATWRTSPASIPAVANRQVFTAATPLPAGGASVTSGNGIPFQVVGTTAPTLGGNASLISYFGDTPANQALVVNYLLGDTSGEQRNGGNFRNRNLPSSSSTAEVVLGDIVDSNPVYSWQEDFGYATIPAAVAPGGSSYASFVAGKASRLPLVYVGANDGMLHAFDATNPTTTPPAGTIPSAPEVFAYVPHAVLPSLGSLTTTTASGVPLLSGLVDPNYLHTFYVDGPVFVGDAYFSTSGGADPIAWHSVLIGTTGAGEHGVAGTPKVTSGHGVFALDVTNVNSANPFTAKNVLWDMDGSAPPYGNGDVNLGDPIGQPIIALMNNGDWAAIFGNGYSSNRGCAVLYIVRLSDGLVRTIDTSGLAATGSCVSSSGANANGLGSPTLLDLDKNGTTDYIFAGDLLGNLWKFDVTSSDPTKWAVAFKAGTSPVPLFTATGPANVPQPIVTPPNLGPTLSGINGYLVYFVTGRMFAVGDAADQNVQSIYAIQDTGVPITTGRSALVQQKVIAASGGNENIQTVNGAYPVVDLTATSGWYIDFPGAGERALSEPFLVGGLTLFSTVIPSSQPCNGGCGGFIYAVNQFNGDGGMNFLSSNGAFYDAIATTVGCVRGLTLVSNGSTLNWYASGNGVNTSSTTLAPVGQGPGNSGTPLVPNGGPSSGTVQYGIGKLNQPGRISWHEVVPQ